MEQSHKTVHKASLVREDGAVSPLCAKSPRPIDLSRATWTLREEAVTCKRCGSILRWRALRSATAKREPSKLRDVRKAA